MRVALNAAGFRHPVVALPLTWLRLGARHRREPRALGTPAMVVLKTTIVVFFIALGAFHYAFTPPTGTGLRPNGFHPG